MSHEINDPEEYVTMAYCFACEQLSLAGDLEPTGHPTTDEGYQLECPRCHSRVHAESFIEYRNPGAVNADE